MQSGQPSGRLHRNWKGSLLQPADHLMTRRRSRSRSDEATAASIDCSAFLYCRSAGCFYFIATFLDLVSAAGAAALLRFVTASSLESPELQVEGKSSWAEPGLFDMRHPESHAQDRGSANKPRQAQLGWPLVHAQICSVLACLMQRLQVSGGLQRLGCPHIGHPFGCSWPRKATSKRTFSIPLVQQKPGHVC